MLLIHTPKNLKKKTIITQISPFDLQNSLQIINFVFSLFNEWRHEFDALFQMTVTIALQNIWSICYGLASISCKCYVTNVLGLKKTSTVRWLLSIDFDDLIHNRILLIQKRCQLNSCSNIWTTSVRVPLLLQRMCSKIYIYIRIEWIAYYRIEKEHLRMRTTEFVFVFFSSSSSLL